MPAITLSVPQDLKTEMDKISFVNWSAVARDAIKEKLVQLKVLNELSEKSKMTKADAMELGKKINRGLVQRYK